MMVADHAVLVVRALFEKLIWGGREGGKLRRVERQRERERERVVCIYTIDRTRVAVNLVIKGPFCYRFNRIMPSRTDRKFGGMATRVGQSALLKFHAACVSTLLSPYRPPHAIHHPPPVGRRKPFLRAVTIWRRAKFISASAAGISPTLGAFEASATAHSLGAFTGLNHKIVPERRRNSTDLREWAALVRWRGIRCVFHPPLPG